MDSLTQASLGAAMGEMVLGKKLGNRAMVLGALAGTIPDLDVLSRLFTSHEIYGLIYHRGITHSIFFTLLASPVFAYLARRYYASSWRKSRIYSLLVLTAVLLLYTGIVLSNVALSYYTGSMVSIVITTILLLCYYPIFQAFNKIHQNRILHIPDIPLKTYSWMFFLAFLTHWLIDACTAYGTQIFEPFSRYRVAFNNISIVDPLYTVPLIIGLILASKMKTGQLRSKVNLVGIGLSSLYMAFTFYAKTVANGVFEQELDRAGIAYTRYTSYPSIFNTILWQITAETEDAFYYGYYSLLKEDKKVKFLKLPKNHDRIEKYRSEEFFQILEWFASGYYNIIETSDGALIFNNLRFGLMGLPEDSTFPMEHRYIFSFELKEEQGNFDVQEYRKLEELNMSEAFATLINRVKGLE